ncbi:hypothetical protein [Pseudoduganella umbonata]|uniref:PEP-CTERM sorting domain-containing protein n=1 Tax=Pseudoduganella umbonata TaxID=864828 RepID=A0ABX5UFE5_9BURK|nr:hypothetical protein [Pseudoduganella umbonata]QCP10482.1 hypothetical protein FCL38_08605 [Pseudoduganella umbonata]
MLSSTLSAAFSAAALLSAVPATALAAEAGASLGPLTFILVDLDLADGIDPSMTFTGTSGSAAAPMATMYLALGDAVTETAVPTWTHPAPIQYVIARSEGALAAMAQFDLTGRVSSTGAMLAAAVDTYVVVAEPGLNVASRVNGDTGETAFTLSANTAVLFSVPYDVSLSTEPPPGAAERLEAGAVEVWLRVAGLGDGHDAVRWLNHAPDGTGFLEVAVENRSGFDQGATFGYGTDIRVESITPVPEPGIVPMLGAGLAVLAAVAGRCPGAQEALSRLARRRRASLGSAISGR